MGPHEHVRAAHPVVAPTLQQRRRAGALPGAQALGFKYKVEELKDTGEDVKKGGAQIEYQDQDPAIHRVFVEECGKSGAEVDMAQFGF